MRQYKLTPLNIVSGLVIIFSIYSAIKPGPEGWGFLALVYILPFGIIGLFVDYVIQRVSKKYSRTFIIEICLLGFLILCYSWTQRTKTFLISNRLKRSYIATVYEVQNAPKLPKNFLSWNYEIKVPENGILLTSSNMKDDLPETKMKTYSGIELNSKSSKLSWGQITEDTVSCNGKTYYYKSWLVDTVCCMYTSKQLDSFKLSLRKNLCR